MNAALPAILQQPSAYGTRDRNSAPSKGEAENFGRMLKAGGEAKDGPTATALDESVAIRAEPASDLGLEADELIAANKATAPTDMARPRKEPKEGESEEQDKPETAEALLPLLSVARPHDRASERQGDAEAAQGRTSADAAASVTKPAERPADEAENSRKSQPIAVLEKPDPATSSRRPEATFGKVLIANLNDLATQAPGRPDMSAESKVAVGGTDTPGEAPGARRNRGTLIANAVSRMGGPREVGDRRPDLPATDQKAQPAPTGQGLLATGAPVVEALAANPASVAALHRVAPAEAHVGQTSVQTLKIQLQPVELGVVTANLRMKGEQLSVEIEVESVEAYNRLSRETDAIARALRSHGIAVDEVVIQTPQNHAATPTREGAGSFTDTSANAGRNFSTGAESGQSGGSGQPNRDAGQDNGYEVDKLSPVEQRIGSGGDRSGVYI